jgi:saccharopine dehydrogenase-like NADP-dependent oxidoreductase
MHIVVLGGCGDMGSYVVRDLVACSDAQVTIADYRLDVAERLADELGERAAARFVDAEDVHSLIEAMESADAAVGCIGPFYHFAPKLTRAAIQARVPYVDICDDWGPMEELAAMDEDAREVGTTVINGLGWTPGITNLMAKKGAANLDKVGEVRMYWGGGAADSEGLAVVMHVFYAVTGQVPTVRGGGRVMVPAGSGKEVVDFPEPLGPVEVFHCGHPETLTVPRVIPADTVFLKGGLTPRWNNRLAEALVNLGFSQSHQSIQRVSRAVHRLERFIGAGGAPYSGARVDVVGRKDDEAATLSYGVTDKMGPLTGIPAAVGAVMLAQGEIEAKGVFAPEDLLEPERIFAELEERGIRIVEM